jgi:opacity protein-like surface antigen
MSVFCFQFSQAQIYELGVFVGGSNFIGDVGATNYISPNQFAIGGIAKWNRSPRHAWRVSATYTDLLADDTKSDDPRRQQRGYGFESTILELSAGMEFNFFDFNLHFDENLFTPYIYTGISTAYHRNFYFNNGSPTSENNKSWAFGIPLVLGVKAKLTESFVFGLEVGARYTFSDELDGSMPDSEWLIDNYSFGNTNNNDWYTFTGITVTYTFGRKPCYCSFDQ